MRLLTCSCLCIVCAYLSICCGFGWFVVYYLVLFGLCVGLVLDFRCCFVCEFLECFLWACALGVYFCWFC